jgi:gluconolactonase
VRTESDGQITVLADRFEGKRFNSPNDVAVRSDGTLWFTDPPWGLTGPHEIPGHWVFKSIRKRASRSRAQVAGHAQRHRVLA